MTLRVPTLQFCEICSAGITADFPGHEWAAILRQRIADGELQYDLSSALQISEPSLPALCSKTQQSHNSHQIILLNSLLYKLQCTEFFEGSNVLQIHFKCILCTQPKPL